MSFWSLVFTSLFVAVAAAPSGNITLEDLNHISFNSFLKLFRQAVVNNVAEEWNTTIRQSHDLEAKLNICNDTATVNDHKCRSCAKDCSMVPSYEDVISSIDPYNYMSVPLNDIANKLGILVDLIEEKSLDFLNSINGFAALYSSPIHGNMREAFKRIREAVFAVKHGFTDDGRFISNTADLSLINATEPGDNFDINVTGIDANTSTCIRKCPDCMSLLLPTQYQIVRAVCDDDIANDTYSFIARVNKLKTVYNSAVDKIHPIMSKIELDQSSMNYSLGYSYTLVYVSAYVNGQYQRYRTQVLFSNMYRTDTAKNMTLEYWNKI